jgi:hypothetical protein
MDPLVPSGLSVDSRSGWSVCPFPGLNDVSFVEKLLTTSGYPLSRLSATGDRHNTLKPRSCHLNSCPWVISEAIIIHLLGLAPAGSWLHRTAARRATYRVGAVKDTLRVTRYQVTLVH